MSLHRWDLGQLWVEVSLGASMTACKDRALNPSKERRDTLALFWFVTGGN